MNKHLKPGQTWYPEIKIYDEDASGNRTARDCTGETIILIIKRTQSETEIAIETLTINWTDQESGEGYFVFDYETTKELTGTYWYQVILYEITTMTVVQPFDIYKLIMNPTLEKDLP